MVPLAEKLRADGVRLMPLEPEPGDETWYVPYPRDTPELVEFEADDAEVQLREWWEEQGLPLLVPLAGPILELARRLEQPTPDDNADVSPFIYVMF